MNPGDYKKKSKFGQLPGDLPLSTKIKAMESNKGGVHKTLKRDEVRKAKRRLRKLPIPGASDYG